VKPKTTAQRVQSLRERRKAQGLARLELWADPGDHSDIKQHAARLQRKREAAAKKGKT
jgi:hypothetical protein